MLMHMTKLLRHSVRIGLIAWLVFGGLHCVVTAGPFSNLVVFGDSLSDVGNIAQAPFINTPGPYYWNGRFSNGPVYAEALATGLGLPALTRSTASGGTDYAYGGAKTTGTGFPDNIFVKDIDDQVGDYLGTANATTLYVVFAGANDLLGGQTNMSIPINSLSTSINGLVTAGARNFLVLNLPPLGYTPRYNGSQSTLTQYNSRTQQYNAALSTMLDGIDAKPDVTVFRLDVAALVSQAIVNPQSFGLTNVTSPAAPGLSPGTTSYDTSRIAPNANQYLFWDDVHPTTRVHAILGERAVQLFFAPGDYNHDAKVDASDYLTWRKNSSGGYIQSDFNVWRTHFGEVLGTGSGSDFIAAFDLAVPEPAAMALALLGLYFAVASRRPRNFATLHVSGC
jgi:phospholipase/lecithinase/hemolysin